MAKKYIIALDQGTTSSRAIVYDKDAHPISSKQLEFKQYYPHPGWVEHNADEIFKSQLKALETVAIDRRSLGQKNWKTSPPCNSLAVQEDSGDL